MHLSGRYIVEKMIIKLDSIKEEVDAPTNDLKTIHETLTTVKAYCDILLDSNEENKELNQRILDEKIFKKTKTKSQKPSQKDINNDANGDSIFDF